MQTERTVAWQQIKDCLAELYRTSKPFLAQAILIGGAACWFYRIRLQQANDPDFKTPPLSPVSENKWLSRDIDFTGIFSGDAMAMLPQQLVTSSNGRKHIEVKGIRLGFAQAGLTIDPEQALQSARVGSFKHENETVEFLVADPVTLYIEKHALTLRRGNENDFLHCSLLREYLAFEVTTEAESVQNSRSSLPELKRVVAFLLVVKNKAPEIIRDPRVQSRLSRLEKGNPLHGLLCELLTDQSA